MAGQQFVSARSLPAPTNPAAPALPADPPPPYPAFSANCSLFIRKMPAFVERTAYRVLGRHTRGLPWEESVEQNEEGQRLVKYMKSRTVIDSVLDAATSALQAL